MSDALTKSLHPRPGFDWRHVAWGRPDSPRSALCSYCSAGIGSNEVPLILWRDDGASAQFCSACMQEWWGIESFGADDDEPEDWP